MKNHFLTALAIAVTLGSSTLIAGAAQTSRLNDSTGVEPMSPGGTVLGSATLWAVIRADGSTARGDGNASSTRLGVGTYQVIFRRNVVNCAYMVTIGNPGTGASAPGEVTMGLRAGNSNGIFVTTHNSAGNLADRNFHVFINC